jgi:hypothetical protein
MICWYVLKEETMRFLFVYGPLFVDVQCVMYLATSSHDEVFYPSIKSIAIQLIHSSI